jgi:hypothetical protein
MMFNVDPLPDNICVIRNATDGKILTNHDFFGYLHKSSEFVSFLRNMMLDIDYRAYRWETRPQGPQEMDADFRFSILDSPELIQKAEPDVFPDIHKNDGAHFRTFPNLGGDALLVSPTSLGGSKSYASLVDFVKSAPDEQFSSLMQALGSTALGRMTERNFYFSTAGAGVAWLHFRFDKTPKYFRNRNLLERK